MAIWIAEMESGMIDVVEMCQFEEPRSENTCERAGMHLSVAGSLEAVSDIIRIAAVSSDCGDDIASRFWLLYGIDRRCEVGKAGVFCGDSASRQESGLLRRARFSNRGPIYLG